MKAKSTNIIIQKKDFSIIVIVSIAVILVVSGLITGETNWGILDFVLMGTLLFGTGSVIMVVSKKVQDIQQRAALILVIVLALLLIWAELAVGIFGSPFAGS